MFLHRVPRRRATRLNDDECNTIFKRQPTGSKSVLLIAQIVRPASLRRFC